MVFNIWMTSNAIYPYYELLTLLAGPDGVSAGTVAVLRRADASLGITLTWDQAARAPMGF